LKKQLHLYLEVRQHIQMEPEAPKATRTKS
jgi:hypothetical protein